MHVECQRADFQVTAARLSRHWYDLAMLADLDHGRTAVADRTLLADVIKHKKVFFHAGYAKYDACLAGQLRQAKSGHLKLALTFPPAGQETTSSKAATALPTVICDRPINGVINP